MLKLEDQNADFESCLEKEQPVVEIKERIKWYYPAYYLSKSLYYHQIKRFYDTFGKENVHLIVFEEMLKDKNQPDLKSTCRFLGVSDNFILKQTIPTLLL